jgi:tetrapyrrole methylase family protein/MazG family protein
LASLPEDLSKFDSFATVIARLRGPDGCPWDREQTHASLRINLLSECYEVLEALDRNDPDKLCEELGDLLLQIVLHAQIAADNGEFEIGDVIKGINSKIIHRHPHVFGSGKAATAEEVMHNWEALKREEREEDTSVLEGVPKSMPALAYAYEISRRAVRMGFEWENLEGVIDKLIEEIREIKDAGSREEKAREFGDLLFTMVNFARWQGIDAEAALREANDKFYKRFTRMEALCRERSLVFNELSFEEMDALWEEAKRETNEDY